jgi:MFS family permease
VETGKVLRFGVYRGWVNLVFAVLASVVALPSMTWGLGIVTESLLNELAISRETWAGYNFWATAISGAFLIPTGLVVDRLGARSVAFVSSLVLGISVWMISRASHGDDLLLAMILARSAGQGVLSVASVALVGKWFVRRVTLAMTIYGVAVILAYMLAEKVTGVWSASIGWRATWEWWGIGITVIVCPLLGLFSRSHPGPQTAFASDETVTLSAMNPVTGAGVVQRQYTLAAAAATPAFWVFCFAGAANGGSQAVVSLFGISILKQNGFADPLAIFLHAVAIVSSIGAIAGLLATGVLGRVLSQASLLRLACILGGASSLLLPVATTPFQADLFGASWGLQCGVLMVVTNTVWAKYYGRQHQGAIEGFTMFVQHAAQAGAPWIMTQVGSYTSGPAVFFNALAVLFAALFLLSLLTASPSTGTSRFPSEQTN